MRTIKSTASIALCLLLLLAWSAITYGFEIHQVESDLQDDTLTVRSKVSMELSEEVIEALQAGIPITFNVHVRVYRDRRVVWDDRIVNRRFDFQLRHRKFPTSYVVQSNNPRKTTVFSRLSEALAEIGMLQTYRVKLPKVHPDDELRGAIRMRLDHSALPGTLRIRTFFQRPWKLNTDWQRIDIQ